MKQPNFPSVSIVSGGAGFIARSLIARLLDDGQTVMAVDNLSRGELRHVEPFLHLATFRFLQADVAQRTQCDEAFRAAGALGSVREVWHLAANSDIPAGVADPDVDFKDTFCTTFELLRAMKAYDVHELHFASSSAIYGDHGDAELHEEMGPLLPISNYGAMKLASEAQISAAAEAHLEIANVFRFPNVVGVPATHGVMLDFVRKLHAAPERLDVLGDGTQQKAYLHVGDLIDAMFFVRASRQSEKPFVVNVGPEDGGVSVSWIAEQVVKRVSPGAQVHYGKGSKGWVGDVPRFRYSTAKLDALGWRRTLSSTSAILRAVEEIVEQERARGGAPT